MFHHYNVHIFKTLIWDCFIFVLKILKNNLKEVVVAQLLVQQKLVRKNVCEQHIKT